MVTTITREDFIKACNDKAAFEEQQRQDKLDNDFRNLVNNLPVDCQQDFVFQDQAYKIDFQNRRFTREFVGTNQTIGTKDTNTDTFKRMSGGMKMMSGGRINKRFINQELGI